MMHLMPYLDAPLQIQQVPDDKATGTRLRQSTLVVAHEEDHPARAHICTQKSSARCTRLTGGDEITISPSRHSCTPSQKWRLPLTVLFSHNT